MLACRVEGWKIFEFFLFDFVCSVHRKDVSVPFRGRGLDIKRPSTPLP